MDVVNAIATITDCKSYFYGHKVFILEVRKGAFLVKPVRGGPSFIQSKVHTQIEELAA